MKFNAILTRMPVVGAMLAGLMFVLPGCPVTTPIDPNAPVVALELVADGVIAPVALVDAGDGSRRLFVVSQPGLIRVIPPGGGVLGLPFLDLSARLPALDRNYDERGLLGLAFHPDYAVNGRFFVYFSAPPSDETPTNFDSETLLCEFRVSDDPNRADPASERVLLRIGQPQRAHKAGQIAFGADGYLYLSTGDGGGVGDADFGHTPDIGNAQDRSSLLGKFLRIDVDEQPYAIPGDNPFVTDVDARPEIWALGFRNPWRWSFDDLGPGNTGRLFAGDVGQSRLEEISLVERGGNYGWRIREGTSCYNVADPGSPLAGCANEDAAGRALIPPILEYGRSSGTAVIGGYVYRGSAIPELAGRYLFGDFSAGFLAADGRVYAATEEPDGSWSRTEVRFAGRSGGRLGRYLYAFGRDAAGELYLLTNSAPNPFGVGAVYRMVNAE